MAIEKTLNTRILNKIDTLENWNGSSLKIKQGEICIATVAASAGTGLAEPVCMIKIGTAEEKTFSELPWSFYAKASDVLAACKSEAGLKAFINDVIADSGLATDDALTALSGRVATAEGEIDDLQAELNTDTTGLKARMSTAEAGITALEGLVGDTAVATQITNAIAALDLVNTYDAKGAAATVQTNLDTYKTSNDAAVQKNTSDIGANTAAITAIKDGATIDSFADVETALTGKETAGAAVQALTDAKAYADGLAGNYDAKGSAATAEVNAKTYAKEYADSLAGNYDAKGSADDALVAAKEYADGQLTTLVGDKSVSTQITEYVDGLDLANTYAAKVHKHVKADITDFAHNHEISEVNGLQDALNDKQAVGDYATKTEAQGYADAKDEAIAAAKKAGDDAQADVDALEAYVGTLPEGATAETIVAYIDEKASGVAGGADAAIQGLDERLKTAEGEIDTLQGLVGDTAVATQISTAVATEKTRAEGIEAGLETRLAAVEGDYLKAADKTALQEQIDANESAIELLTNGVSSEEVDGVNDLIQYVKDHGTEVTGMKTDISNNTKAINDEKTRAEGVEGELDTRLQAVEAAVGETGSVATAIEEAVAEAKGYTDAEIQELADGAVKTNTTNIAELQGLVGDTAVTTQINDAINTLKNGQLTTMQGEIDAVEDRATALEAKSHEHANKTVLDGIEATDIAAWDGKVDDVTATAESGLKATRTGNTVAIEIDDSVTFIFDCGDSTGV